MRGLIRIAIVLVTVSMAFMLSACAQEVPLEKTTKKMDLEGEETLQIKEIIEDSIKISE